MVSSRLLLYATIYGVLNAGGLLLVRASFRAGDATDSIVQAVREADVRLLAGLALFVMSFLLGMAAARSFPVVLLYPVLAGTAYGLIALGSWIFLGETLAGLDWVGVALAAAGVGILAR